MDSLVLALLLAVVALVYATVGQAGGTAFLAVMAAMGMPAAELRPTALGLNVLAAAFSTWQLHRAGAIDWHLLGVLAAPSLPTAFLGGLIVLESGLYFGLVGLVLMAASILMMVRPGQTTARPIGWAIAIPTGAGVGFLSGLTGVGGGIFLAPVLIGAGWTTAKQAAGLSPPFILANSIVGLAGALAAGDRVTSEFGLYALSAVAGAAAGSLIGRRLLSERATRLVLAAILVVAAGKLLLA